MSLKNKSYLKIGRHYTECFKKHGDSNFGVDWPNEDDAIRRYEVMLNTIFNDARLKKYNILDFGCGTSALYDYIIKKNLDDKINYTGIDISEEYIKTSKEKYPNNTYYFQDILDGNITLNEYDFILLNSVFTQSLSLSDNDMFDFVKSIIIKLFPYSRYGLYFNVMSPVVDYKRSGAFHLSFEQVSEFLCENITRSFTLNHNYMPYEYFVCAYKDDDFYS